MTRDTSGANTIGGYPWDADVGAMFPSLYRELRAIAHRQLSGRRDGATLATTALVHEAYLKLVNQETAASRDRTHFLGMAAVAMRHILIDHAKARVAVKRGGAVRPVTFDEAIMSAAEQPAALLNLDEALRDLASLNRRLAQVVELRFFGGLSHEEIANVFGVTVRTVERDWMKARMLLRQALAS